MEHIRQYLLTVISAAVICAFIRAITHKKGASAAIVNVVAAIFLVITVIAPWKQWSFSDITEYIQDYSDDADAIVSSGIAAAQTETASIIKKQAEAYVEDKAMSLGIDLRAEVEVSDSSPPQPESIVISANASPYFKQRITQYISTELGIPEANQVWN